jgi:polyhydroxybutyrate depolymerase
LTVLVLILFAGFTLLAARCAAQSIVHRPLATKIDLNRNARKVKTIEGSRADDAKLGPGEYERFIEVDGRERRYELHVPEKYEDVQPMPLVLNFHGGGGRAGTARLESQMDEKADSAGFIVAYLDGAGEDKEKLLTWNAGNCCGYAMEKNVDDVKFVEHMLDDVAKFFRIDEKRIYATGASNGGMMAHRLGCELADKVAAIAPVVGPLGLKACRPSRPISVMHFHGTADQNAPFEGGVGSHSLSKTRFTSVEETIRTWVVAVGATEKPVDVRRIEDEAVMTTYRAEDTEIVLVAIDGMGHNWPGGRRMAKESYSGAMSKKISANDMMWSFFERHPMKD